MRTYTYIDPGTNKPVRAKSFDEVQDALIVHVLTHVEAAEILGGLDPNIVALWDPHVWLDMVLSENESAATNHVIAIKFITEAYDYFS